MPKACITTVGFPSTIEGIKLMLKRNHKIGNGGDLDVLLDPTRTQSMMWTSPTNFNEGDLFFFYHSVSGLQQIKKFLSHSRNGLSPEAYNYLKIVESKSASMAGKIFAVAEAKGKATKNSDPSYTFKEKSCCPILKIHVFDNPLLMKSLDLTTIKRKSAITYLGITGFKEIQEKLAQNNSLPHILEQFEIGDDRFGSTSSSNLKLICNKW